jgi:hypothetical protein
MRHCEYHMFLLAAFERAVGTQPPPAAYVVRRWTDALDHLTQNTGRL